MLWFLWIQSFSEQEPGDGSHCTSVKALMNALRRSGIRLPELGMILKLRLKGKTHRSNLVLDFLKLFISFCSYSHHCVPCFLSKNQHYRPKCTGIPVDLRKDLCKSLGYQFWHCSVEEHRYRVTRQNIRFKNAKGKGECLVSSLFFHLNGYLSSKVVFYLRFVSFT